MEIIFYLILSYFFIVFILSRFFVPHLLFGYDPIPENIPSSMQEKIEELKFSSNSPKDFLNLTFNFLGEKYLTGRFNIFIKINFLFKPVDEVWQLNGFMPCTQSSYIMRIFLIKSGFFKNDEIKKRHTMVMFNIHQYLQVKADNTWLDVDVGEKQRGMPIGRHLSFFG